MKKLIFRKFLIDTFYSFFGLIISLSIIVWVIQAVNYLDFISEDGHGFKVYFLYTFYNFPKIFSKLFLISFFISLFYIILKYENDNELSIYWSVGISKINSVTDISLLEASVRDDLNTNAPRTMAVIDPVKLVIENYPEKKIELLKAPNHPQNQEMGSRLISFTREIYIDKTEDCLKGIDHIFKKKDGYPVRYNFRFYINPKLTAIKTTP